MTIDKRGYVVGKFGLELEGSPAGWVHSASGGHARADVIFEKLGPDHTVKKHLSGVKYEEITIETGTGMGKAFYDWLKQTFANKFTRKNGAIIAADYNHNEMTRKEFKSGLITEIGMPALDAASKDAAKMTVKIQPETTRNATASKASVSGKYGTDAVIQKKWLPANFRLKIDGLDCTRVNKVGELVMKQNVIEHAVGEMRDYEQEASNLEVPNLVVTMAESHADDWYKWHEDFVIKGNNGEDKEKTGTLEYLTSNLQETLFTLTFKHLGIFSLEEEKVGSGSENVHRVRAQLYVESIDFTFKPGATT